MLPFKPGILLLMKKAPVPIVPNGIAGAYESFPRSQLLPRLSPLFWPATGADVAVSIGRPLLPAHFAKLGREEILKDLFHAVQAQVRRAERLRRKR
jgi:1-acyl-sn-glycerol-3-phosphate acyltransferase